MGHQGRNGEAGSRQQRQRRAPSARPERGARRGRGRGSLDGARRGYGPFGRPWGAGRPDVRGGRVPGHRRARKPGPRCSRGGASPTLPAAAQTCCPRPASVSLSPLLLWGFAPGRLPRSGQRPSPSRLRSRSAGRRCRAVARRLAACADGLLAGLRAVQEPGLRWFSFCRQHSARPANGTCSNPVV